jgi:structural maintenance of chromosome 2
MENDIKQAEVDVKGAHAQIIKLHKDLAALNTKLGKHEVRLWPMRVVLSDCPYTTQADHAKAEQKLLEERATLIQFDNELKDLENAIREQKRGVSDAEVELTKMEHDITALE